MNAKLRKAFQFFFINAGYAVGERAKGALSLARAEIAAERLPVRAEWQGDDNPDLSWMDAEQLKNVREVAGCVVMRTDTGETLATLWGNHRS